MWKRDYQLDLGGLPVGKMRWPSLRTCELSLYDEIYRFRREGMMWNQISVVRREFEVSYAVSNEARFNFPMGKRTLDIVMDDVPWRLVSNFWRSRWHWEDQQGNKVIDYQIGVFSYEGAAVLEPAFLKEMPEALLLASLGWYLVCEIRMAQSGGA